MASTSLLHSPPSSIHTKFAFSSSSTLVRPSPRIQYGISARASTKSPVPDSFDSRKIHPLVGTTLFGKPSGEEEASASSTRQPLSSNWDISGAATLPRLEELDTTNMLLRQRIIFLGSQVDDMTADYIISQLLFLDAEDSTKDIKLFINSPGGSITAGMGIYDAMKLCKADVSTVCLGLAASMGAFLLAAGTKGKRFCMPNGRVMIHQPLGTAGGKAIDMGIRIREMAYHKIKLNKIFSRITGKPESQIELDTDRDNFMNAWQAKEYGLVDVVIDDGKPGLVAPLADTSPPPRTRVLGLSGLQDAQKAEKNTPSDNKPEENKDDKST
uniref:ATP-dependent Clp protease proteolytic subunit n=1 Tax=Kalanchoe fedtschenkoi TaxID=63787 RepID=A0A7N0RHD4_KALFE